MRQIKARAAAAPDRVIAPLAWSLTALLSLVLLLAALPSQAATKDSDVFGRWITDKTQPDMDYPPARRASWWWPCRPRPWAG
jgi:hypothetical protein